MSVSRIRSSSSLWGTELALAAVIALGSFPGEAAEKKAEASAEAPAQTRVTGPCTDSEKWEFSEALQRVVPEASRNEFNASLEKKEHPVRGFAEAQSLAKSKSPLAGAFADYWTGRALFTAGLFGPAIFRLNTLVERPPTPAIAPIQIAAMACLEIIHDTYTVSVFFDRTLLNLPAYFKPGVATPETMPVVWESGIHLLMRRLKNNASQETVEKVVRLLKGSGPYEDYARALWAAKRERPEEALESLVRLADAETLPPSIQTRQNEVRLLLARVLYEQHRYADSVKYLDAVDKRANELVPALQMASWVELARENYAKAIGASIGLQSGGLRGTFAPEALMVAAISLNELCQFPESLRTIATFKKNYESAYMWLRAHADVAEKKKERLYPLAVAFLKEEKAEVPERVASEWIRSPIFLVHQQAINVSFAMAKSIPGLIQEAQTFATTKAAETRALKEKTDQAIEASRSSVRPPERYPASLRPDVGSVAVAEARQRRLEDAIPRWTKILVGYRELSLKRRDQLMARIEALIRALNDRMLRQLDGVLENNDLIEAEIWNGASQDIVWQNANPEFATLVKTGKLKSDRPPAGSARDIYDWGASRSRDGKEEIWEDELGAMKANLEDNCANKEKYMKLAKRR